MSDYKKKLKDDLLEQFKDKPNLNDLMEVVGVQLDDIYLFFEQLQNERSVDTAVGKQLDRIGDIVVFTREEVRRQTGKSDDETYRRYIMYKILKNTCRCTYYDMMSVINMFWNGTPLRYRESENMPATIQLEFEAFQGLTEEDLILPVIRAGGVGIKLTMQRKNNVFLYAGMILRKKITTTVWCDVPIIETYLTDENDVVLTDESDVCLVEWR